MVPGAWGVLNPLGSPCWSLCLQLGGIWGLQVLREALWKCGLFPWSWVGAWSRWRREELAMAQMWPLQARGDLAPSEGIGCAVELLQMARPEGTQEHGMPRQGSLF